MHVRNVGVVGGALIAFAAMMWAAGCGGQSVEIDSPDAATLDAQVDDAPAFDAQAADAARCPPHQTMCSGACTDTRFDPSACGSCANSCGPGEVCASGACTSTCPSTQAACKDEDGGLRCADALNDNANCGYCGNVCGAGTICSNGKCSLTCGADETRCVAGDATAFCTNLQTDPDDCNLCGNACPTGNNTASVFCSSGKCGVTCNNGTLDCNGNGIDGCEVTPAYDRENCGTCGNICPVGANCVNGGCTCGTGYNQTLEVCNGACVDVQRDPTNCGSCGTRCTSTNLYQTADCVESACHTSNRAVITTGNPVTSIAIDDTYLYFVRQGTGIQRVTKGSTAETPVTLIADTTAYGMAINAGTIFWTSSAGVHKCPVTGCVGAPKAVSDVPSYNARIVVDDTNFYWTPSGLYACAQTGCEDAPVQMATYAPYWMSPGASSLFVSTYSYAPPYGNAIQSITPTSPPTSTPISSTEFNQSGVAYFGGQLYWESTGSPAYVVSCDPTACVPKPLAALPATQNYGAAMAADATAVVWAADGIHETILATATDTVIANIKSGANQIVLDATNVYWFGSDGVYWAAR